MFIYSCKHQAEFFCKVARCKKRNSKIGNEIAQTANTKWLIIIIIIAVLSDNPCGPIMVA